MNILLIGGPFHWRTMRLPADFNHYDLHLPLPVQITNAGGLDPFSGPMPDISYATYVRTGAQIAPFRGWPGGHIFECAP
jgi:hypothetical protein